MVRTDKLTGHETVWIVHIHRKKRNFWEETTNYSQILPKKLFFKLQRRLWRGMSQRWRINVTSDSKNAAQINARAKATEKDFSSTGSPTQNKGTTLPPSISRDSWDKKIRIWDTETFQRPHVSFALNIVQSRDFS